MMQHAYIADIACARRPDMLEPVFAAVFGGLMLHEEFGVATAVGGALAISAVLIRCADPEQIQGAYKETAKNIRASLKPKKT